tara:strand:+ start:578 stop:868 length:291 start_codon:yes stop_codon:yes gene_type:complete
MIAFKLDLKSILYLSSLNKYIYINLDNIFYNDLAYNLYSRIFWIKASLRPIKKSKPLKNMKQELIRVELFQKHLDNLNGMRWTKKDFYNYWKFDNL